MLKRLRTSVFAALLIPALAAPALAQGVGSAIDPERLQAATELYEVLSPVLTTQMAEVATDQAWDSFEASIPPSVNEQVRAELKAEIAQFMTEILTYALARGPEIYAAIFTADELRELKAFYETPLGMKLIGSEPQLMAELNNITPILTERLGELQTRLLAVLDRNGIPH